MAVAAVVAVSGITLADKNADAAKGPSVSIERSIDRPGRDYHGFDAGSAGVHACMSACEKDARCKAFTYVRPGVQGKLARCWLKDSVPKARLSSCCDSGVKLTAAALVPVGLSPALIKPPAVPEAQRVRSVEVLLQVYVQCWIDVLAAPPRLGVSLVKEGSGERTDLWVSLYRTDTRIGPYRRIDWYRGRADLTPGVYERSFFQADYRARVVWGSRLGYSGSRECAEGVRYFRGMRLTHVESPLSPNRYGRFPALVRLLPYGERLILQADSLSPSLPQGASLPMPTPVQ
jgi:hypothetical protein